MSTGSTSTTTVDRSYYRSVPEDSQIHLRDYIRIVLAHRWLALTIFSLVFGASIYYVNTTDPIYRATVTLSQEPTSTSQLLLNGMNNIQRPNSSSNAEQEFLTSPEVMTNIVRQLSYLGAGDSFHIYMSSPVATSNSSFHRKLANKWLQITVDRESRISVPMPIGQISIAGLTVMEALELLEKRAMSYDRSAKVLISQLKFSEVRPSLTDINRLNETLTIKAPRSENIMYLSTVADTPRKTKLIANAAAYIYTQSLTERKQRELDLAVAALTRQIDGAQTEMANDTEKLYNARKNLSLATRASSDRSGINSLLDLLEDYRAELQAVKDQVQMTQARLKDLKDRSTAVRNQMKPSDELMEMMSLTDRIADIRRTIADLELQKKVLLSEKMEQHRDVVAIDRQLEAARDKLRQLLSKIKNESSSTANPLMTLNNLEKEAISLEMKLKELSQQEQYLMTKIENFEREHPDLVSEDLELMSLQRKVQLNDQRYLSLLNNMDQVSLMKEVQTGGVDILKHATKARLIKPRKTMTMAFGVGLGLMLGVGIALFLEYMDDSIRRKEDVERELNLEVIGTVPMIPISVVQKVVSRKNEENGDSNQSEPGVELVVGDGRKTKHDRGYQKRMEQLVNRVVVNMKTRSQVLESYRTLRSNIQFAAVDEPVKVFLVTSASQGDGKTLTASNLAITMAWGGKKVLLVDCDLRRPRQHSVFGVPREHGLSEYLTDSWEDAKIKLARPSGVKNLDLVVCGAIPPNPAELIISKKLVDLIEEWRLQYDYIIFDSPPVISVADASILSKRVDRTLLIIKSAVTKKQIAAHAKDILEKVGGKIFGVVLNNVDFSKQYGYYYYYYYYRNYYSSQDDLL